LSSLFLDCFFEQQIKAAKTADKWGTYNGFAIVIKFKLYAAYILKLQKNIFCLFKLEVAEEYALPFIHRSCNGIQLNSIPN
jgi:hypothetical protein